MTDAVIFVGTSKSSLALIRFKKLQEFGNENHFNAIWVEKKSGAARFFCIIGLLLQVIIHRKKTWICHGSYWPELFILVFARVKFSLIVQGSELYLNGYLRKKLHCFLLNNSFVVGCRTIEQIKMLSSLAPKASSFILRMDDYVPPCIANSEQRRYTISVRASAPIYRQELALNIANKINDFSENKTRTLYICYNGTDQDPDNNLFDEKIHGPIDRLSLAKLLASAQFVISVPKTDGLSNVVIEALIQGAFIVCSDATFKDEFGEFRERFVVIPEELFDAPEALTNFLYTRLNKLNMIGPTEQELLKIHRNFSFRSSSLRTLIGLET